MEYPVVKITMAEINQAFLDSGGSIDGMFRRLRVLTKERGLSYAKSSEIGIRTWRNARRDWCLQNYVLPPIVMGMRAKEG